MRDDGDKITVLFGEVGYKTLALETVQENGLRTLIEQSEDRQQNA